MIHYVGSKPYFQYQSTSEIFWDIFSNMSFNLLKKYSDRKIHIFCRQIPDNIKINDDDILFFSDDADLSKINKYKNIKLWMGGKDKKIPNNINFYCIPGIYETPSLLQKIQKKIFLYIDFFKILAEKYDYLKKNYDRKIDIFTDKVNFLPSTSISLLLLANLVTKPNNIKIYDMIYNDALPHNRPFDNLILNNIKDPSFNGVVFKDNLENHLKYLKKNQKIKLEKKIIIIGNSDNVKLNELGKKIDSFDMVFRMNDFKIKEYEKYVGTKISKIFFHTATKKMEIIKNFPDEKLLLFLTKFDIQNIHIKYNRLKEKWGKNPKTIDMDYKILNKYSFQKFGKDSNKWFTTGLATIYYTILNYFHDYKIFIYGFDLHKHDKTLKHYDGSEGVFSFHDFNEYLIIQKLLEDGFINILK